jgi:manganese transport protein
MHPETHTLSEFTIPSFEKIAVALDFSENDEKLLAYAIGQGKANTHYLLIHIVESASAKLFGQESDDYESRKDKEHMDFYVEQLQERGFHAEGYLGYKNRSKEIVRIVKGINADMLVVGAHGHSGLKDFIYGETVNTVRHELKIPVLIVNL